MASGSSENSANAAASSRVRSRSARWLRAVSFWATATAAATSRRVVLSRLAICPGGDAEQAHLLDGVDLVGVVEAGAVLVLCPLGGEAVEVAASSVASSPMTRTGIAARPLWTAAAVRRWPVRTRSWPSAVRTAVGRGHDAVLADGLQESLGQAEVCADVGVDEQGGGIDGDEFERFRVCHDLIITCLSARWQPHRLIYNVSKCELGHRRNWLLPGHMPVAPARFGLRLGLGAHTAIGVRSGTVRSCRR